MPAGPERALSAAGRRFAIATPHAAASRAGLDAFEAGGTAVDAALAAAVTLAVVYPHMCGVGGDLFALLREPDGRVVALNASGAAPAAIDVDALRSTGPTMPELGPAPFTVPGAVSGWSELARRSSLGFARAFEGPVALARDGVPVASSLAEVLREGDPELIFAVGGGLEIFCPGGTPLIEGQRLVQPSLARTLETIAAEGPSALYGGRVGEQLVAGIRDVGSAMTLEDLARHEPEIGEPLVGRYRDLEVSVVPPTSQGFVLLQILGLVERLGIDPDPLGADAATWAEIVRAAAADRDRFNADPRFADVPIDELVSEEHLAELAERIRRTSSPAPASPLHGDTIALVAADGEGRAVSLIQSLASGFGSGVLEPTTGILCHNRGQGFSLDPGSPNVLAGGKRPAHSLMPVLVHRGGQLSAVSGSMGGGAQPQINAMNLIRAFDRSMAPLEALDAPRYLVGGMDFFLVERSVETESRVPASVRSRLEAAGHRIVELGERDSSTGHAHLILAEPDGSLSVATDPRADGEAIAV